MSGVFHLSAFSRFPSRSALCCLVAIVDERVYQTAAGGGEPLGEWEPVLGVTCRSSKPPYRANEALQPQSFRKVSNWLVTVRLAGLRAFSPR